MASQTKPKMTLYQFPFYRSFKPLWLIHELGVQDDVALVKLDSDKKEAEEYREYKKNVHPHGTIPALVVEGEGVILESTAICLYLADLYGKLAPPLHKRRDYYDWAMYATASLEEPMEFLYGQWVAPVPNPPDPEGVKKHTSKIDIILTRLTKTLGSRDYLCGDFTAADIVLGFLLWFITQDNFNGGSLVKDFPAVQAYVKRLSERPGFKAAVEAQGK